MLHLYYYEGYQTAEIAALTGLREGSVRSRLTRARTRLRQVLKENTNEALSLLYGPYHRARRTPAKGAGGGGARGAPLAGPPGG